MNTSSHEGHRQRLREKFLKNGLEGFLDYEIIELLLTLGTPRSDCKQPAKSALKQFGSLKAVLEADIKDLKAIKGIGDKNVFGLKLSQAVSRKYLSDRILNQDFVRSSDDVLTYLKHNLRDKNHEVFMVIYLNGRNQILKMEELFTISVYTENNPGLLNRIATIFLKRHINIESLNVSRSEIENVHRFTIVARMSELAVKKLVGQIEKQIEVIKAYYHTDDEIISEALYVLSLYYEDGHAFCEGKRYGRPEERKRCRNEIAQLKRFIKKHAEDFSPSIKEAILSRLECNGI